MKTLTLTDEVTGILTAAGLNPAPLNPIGYPASPGFTVGPFPSAPPRAAVTWHDQPGSEAAASGLNQCSRALETAGYRATLVSARDHRDYLAVLPATHQ